MPAGSLPAAVFTQNEQIKRKEVETWEVIANLCAVQLSKRAKSKKKLKGIPFSQCATIPAHILLRAFIKKGAAIWCEMITGCIREDSRVYKVNTDKPYIRDMGKYWYLSEQEKEAVKYLLNN